MPCKGGDCNYLLTLIVPAHYTRYVPYLASWFLFKDHLRKIIDNQPGRVTISSSQNQLEGNIYCYCCTITDEKDAETVYKYYENEEWVQMQLWETFGSNKGPCLLKRSCSRTKGKFGQFGRTHATLLPGYIQPQPILNYPYTADLYVHSYAVTDYYSTYSPTSEPTSNQPPAYDTSTTGLPTSIHYGATSIEVNGTFVQNPGYGAELEERKSFHETTRSRKVCRYQPGVADSQSSMASKGRLGHNASTFEPPLIVNGSIVSCGQR